MNADMLSSAIRTYYAIIHVLEKVIIDNGIILHTRTLSEQISQLHLPSNSIFPPTD